ncbi:putative outer membrane starch-binding protein [Chitinophaga skermanii]|uniref:Putative outer membrane starch-binding protein n=1 Tax=Chitinophaga skermanii TaxID=331697 RepID=A0A327Q6D8_9BACT|nr:RagB/SusD family nutrient uptake outer membrane protein [Chitinophaga skermanii]RAI99443.1 putative outer membrane starch-binding protein [Chitinophaga skermanii]
MKKLIYAALLAGVALTSCRKDFLTKLPPSALVDDSYWTSEANVRTYAYQFYPRYFRGYGSGFTAGSYYMGQTINDDFVQVSPALFTDRIPATDAGAYRWNFENVRKLNYYINRLERVPMDSATMNHWRGVARFFRAMEYAQLVRTYGDVPYYDKVMTETETDELFKPRDPRTTVMDNVLADFEFAAKNVKLKDGTPGLEIDRYIVLAFMSRIFLFEGTFEKYHNIDQTRATKYLTAAKNAADEVLKSGLYTVNPNYRGIFASADLSANKEVLMYRKYEAALLTHSLMSYNNMEPQPNGPTKDLIESYLCKDGLPIGLSPLYKGDTTITDVFANRDPRMGATYAKQYRVNGNISNFSASGYVCVKFLDDALAASGDAAAKSSTNVSDAPIIRISEVMLNYIEAAAELGAVSQADVDRTINKIRGRDITMAPLKVVGGMPADTSGNVFDDPKRDPTVSSILWEIRRERRVELVFEGLRLDDLKRWKKLDYADTKVNPTKYYGAYINKAQFPDAKDKLVGGGSAGYIWTANSTVAQRVVTDRNYLEPLPLDQIKMYTDVGKELKQNPGWVQ